MPKLSAQRLTDAFCRGTKPQAGKSYPDAVERGLELRVSDAGKKTWTFRYRTLDGTQRRLLLGSYSSDPTGGAPKGSGGAGDGPDCLDLEAARRATRKARAVVDEGGDPSEVRQLKRQQAKSEPIRTLDDLAQSYFAATARGSYMPRGHKKRASSLNNEKDVYRVHIKPSLGKARLDAVTRPMVRHALEELLDKGITSQANKAQAIIRQMLTYAVNAIGRLPVNPLIGMTRVAPEKPRARVYTDAELRAIWTGLCNPESLSIPAEAAAIRRDGASVQVGASMRILIQLAMLLLQRRNEIAGMCTAELDLIHGVWIIPEERMKTRRPHAVPLPPRAVELIKEALALNEGRARANNALVFQSRLDADKCVNGASVSSALGRVCLALGIKNGTVHDLRRTGSTIMTSERLGVSPFIRSKVLGHSDDGGGAAVSALHYDANSYIAEKRRALEVWEGLLLEIVGERERASNVANIRTATAP